MNRILLPEVDLVPSPAPAPDSLYDRSYYGELGRGMRRSAAAVVPHLVELFKPKSVVDVGCGCGTWVEAFRARGVADVLGLDGAWAREAGLEFPAQLFHAADPTHPVRFERTFDLVLCLEVAEDLPSAAAPTLVETLTRLGPVVVFSAAVPFQSGQGHVNEQWPSYWSRHFASHDFICLDALREHFWSNRSIEVWYRQNLLLFARAGRVAEDVHRAVRTATPVATPRDLVHPELYLRLVEQKAEWQRYTDLLKLRVADLDHQLERFRASPLGRIHAFLERRPAWLRPGSGRTVREARAPLEDSDGRS